MSSTGWVWLGKGHGCDYMTVPSKHCGVITGINHPGFQQGPEGVHSTNSSLQAPLEGQAPSPLIRTKGSMFVQNPFELGNCAQEMSHHILCPACEHPSKSTGSAIASGTTRSQLSLGQVGTLPRLLKGQMKQFRPWIRPSLSPQWQVVASNLVVSSECEGFQELPPSTPF